MKSAGDIARQLEEEADLVDSSRPEARPPHLERANAAEVEISRLKVELRELQEAHQQFVGYVVENFYNGNQVKALDEYEAWLSASPEEPATGPVSILPDDVTDEEAESFLDAITDPVPSEEPG